MRDRLDVVFIGIGHNIVAIDTATGEERWRTKLKRGSYVTIHVTQDAVFAGAGGELFCLDPATGALRWKNRLPGLGMGLLTFGESTASIATDAAAQAAAGAM